ncbi:MAG: hypothetical protein J5U17_11070 [Candidatus Methanoperedens sp.]|nr:hypothetical protein [Candidatus Methanoperedens sp.]MCE8426303.1 hypothetical protein [Candidatus Methanoperedens sp.]MCE8428567.1 hypothetical protein [Candidatus Methanoperedens sp.]
MREGYEVIAVNYWREVKLDIKKILSGFWNTLLFIHNCEDFKEVVDFFKQMPYTGKIVYISLTKTNDIIITQFKDTNFKMFVVDCISKMLFEKLDTDKCFFEDAPSDLSQVFILIEKYLKKMNPDLLIIDSVTPFINFSTYSRSEIQQFEQFLEKFREKNALTACKFILIYEDLLLKELKYLPTLEVDVVLKMDVLVGRINWEG